MSVVKACLVLFVLSLSCSAGSKTAGGGTTVSDGHRVRIGAEVLLEHYMDSLVNKRVGIVCNQTSVLPDGTHLVDTLLSRGVTITALFGPEHGIRGNAGAGETVASGRDAQTGIPIYSLYGKTQKPTAAMLKDVDVLLFDIQDAGARFYTYLSTMGYCIEAAAENHKTIIILDRPNPLGGFPVDGPVLDTAYRSFVGMFPVPFRHGMTFGELAKMIAGERWVNTGAGVDLKVIPMEDWNRTMWYDETGLRWIPPSPNMKTTATAAVYPGTCLFEATNVTEGRGTEKPFEYIGAPWIDKDTLAERLNNEHPAGAAFDPIEFTPRPDSIAAPNPKFKNEQCGGVYVRVTDRNAFKPFETALLMLRAIQELYPSAFSIKKDSFNRLAGINLLDANGKLRTDIPFDAIDAQCNAFEKLREKYLLYK